MKNKIDWKNHLIELAVVIIGITIAFALNNWQQSHEDASLERKYLAALTEDITSDIEQLEGLIAFYDSTLNNVQRLDALLKQKSQKDSINLYSQGLFVITEFAPQSNTYESLKTSGQMEIISDFAMKQQIHEVYLEYITVAQYEAVYKNFINQYVMPFFIKNVNFQNFDIAGSVILNDFQFANIVQGYIAALIQKLAGYRDALKKSQLLRETFEGYK